MRESWAWRLSCIGLACLTVLALFSAACGNSGSRWLSADSASVRAAEPGAVLASTTWRVQPSSGDSLQVKRVLVRTSGPADVPLTTSAQVLAPAGPASAVLIVGHATQPIADGCAPSMLDPEPWLTDLVQQGVAVVEVDFPGFGTEGPAHYLVAASSGRSLLDVARLARDEFGDVPLWVAGFSEGGHAALVAAHLQPTYAADVELAGVVSGTPWVGGYSMLLRTLDPNEVDSLTLEIPGISALFARQAAGLARAYGLDPAELLTTAGLSWLADQERPRECAEPTAPVQRLFVSDVSAPTLDALRAVIETDRALIDVTQTPLWIVAAAGDFFFPPADLAGLEEHLCVGGSAVRSRSVPGSHNAAEAPFRAAVTELALGLEPPNFRDACASAP